MSQLKESLMNEFMQCVAYRILKRRGAWGGVLLLLTLSTEDMHWMLLEDSGPVADVGDINDDIDDE